jgi:hypothetical protein
MITHFEENDVHEMASNPDMNKIVFAQDSQIYLVTLPSDEEMTQLQEQSKK